MEKTRTIEYPDLLNWTLPTIGTGKMITAPFYDDGWLYVPLDQDDSTIPNVAIERVEQMENSGVKIQGIIIAHEIPPEVEVAETIQIAEIPPDFPNEPETIKITSLEEAIRIEWAKGVKPEWWDEIDWEMVKQKGWEITLGVLKIAGIVVAVFTVGVLAIAAIGALIAPLLMFGAAIAAVACVAGGDPCLIVVDSEDNWILIHRWWED